MYECTKNDKYGVCIALAVRTENKSKFALIWEENTWIVVQPELEFQVFNEGNTCAQTLIQPKSTNSTLNQLDQQIESQIKFEGVHGGRLVGVRANHMDPLCLPHWGNPLLAIVIISLLSWFIRLV